MEIRNIDNNRKEYIDMLLLADPSKEMVEKYINDGEMFVGFVDSKPVCVCLVTEINNSLCELKNLATLPKYRNKGFGKEILKSAFSHCKKRYKTMLVGTGNSSLNNIKFYKSLGFKYSHTIPNFFTDNYKEEIIEDGIKCEDLLYFKKELK